MTKSNGWKRISHRGGRAPLVVALATLIGLMWSGGDTRVGAVHASTMCGIALPDDGDYCASDSCGPCGEGEGDCDSGQCQDGLECVEEGSVDRCRPEDSDPVEGSSNFQVKIDGVWKGICCNGRTPEVSDEDCRWTEDERALTDEEEDRVLDCSEGGPDDCDCGGGDGEAMHGIFGGINSSIERSFGGPIYPDWHEETCIFVEDDGELATRWIDEGCPDFRLR